jgi:plasmid stabilization system protein ParE
MSARRRRFVLSLQARSDLSDVLLYTERQWGLAQVRSYSAQLKAAFEQLTRFPGLGNLRPEFGSGARGHRVRQHVVIYETSDAEVRILCILHVRRDLGAELDQDAE